MVGLCFGNAAAYHALKRTGRAGLNMVGRERPGEGRRRKREERKEKKGNARAKMEIFYSV